MQVVHLFEVCYRYKFLNCRKLELHAHSSYLAIIRCSEDIATCKDTLKFVHSLISECMNKLLSVLACIIIHV